MKKRTFVIRSEDIIARVNTFLTAQPKSPLIEVVVRNYKKDRSLMQNALLWLWQTVISEELGWSKEEVHYDMKKRLLVPIYERDDLGYAGMIQAVRRVYAGGSRDDANAMFKQIVKLTSTTDANVKQFTEYLNDIERDMMSKGISLPHPEDRYYDAMGIKNEIS